MDAFLKLFSQDLDLLSGYFLEALLLAHLLV